MQTCPNCGLENDDNWPLDINGEIKEGGCQMCWESECDAEWWRITMLIYGPQYDAFVPLGVY